jgi:hypothetical protein
MNQVKICYHFLTAILLLYLIVVYKKINIFIKILLFLIAIVHLYDTLWFLNYNGNAPI